MSDIKKGEGEDENKLQLNVPRRIVLRKTVEGGSIKQNFSHGRSKSVVVEVRKKRTFVKASEEVLSNVGKVGGANEPTAADKQKGQPVALPSGARQQILTPMSVEERASFQKRQDGEKREVARIRVEGRTKGAEPVQEAVEATKTELPQAGVPVKKPDVSIPERSVVSETAHDPLKGHVAEPSLDPAPSKTPSTPVAVLPQESAIVQKSSVVQDATILPPSPKVDEVVLQRTSPVQASEVRVHRDEELVLRMDAAPVAQLPSIAPVPPLPSSSSPRPSTAPVSTKQPPSGLNAGSPSGGTVVGKMVPAPVKRAEKSVSQALGKSPLLDVGAAVPRKLTRAQREDVARKKTEDLVTKRLSQLDEMRRQKQEVDEKRRLEQEGGTAALPARAILKTNKVKVKRKGKKEPGEEEKQVPVRRNRSAARGRSFRKDEMAALAPMVREVTIPEVITVGELASRMAVKSSEVIKKLMAQGMMVTINQPLDQDTATLVVEEMGHKAKPISEAATIDAELSDDVSKSSELKTRPPVVTVMGHVDHGKTSLLDAIRKTDVASREFGGITQHIGAYQVTMDNGSSITFLDTPGHAAFTSMRARGAHVTDLVVLVVAADDGVMPQTIEAVHHAKDAKVPIVVAINKMDKEGVNPDRVIQQLSDLGLVPEDWGGDTIFVKVSAKKGIGIENLEEMILLQAEVLNLQADVDQRARGSIVEAKLDRGRGPVATCLVQNGTLRVGDIFVVGTEWGKIRGLIDDKGRAVSSASPSMPVEIIGFSGVPEAGDDLITVPDERRAKEIAAFRMRKSKEMDQAKHAPQMDDIFDQIQRGELDEVKVIIKGDVRGSVEAVAETLSKITHADVRVTIIHTGVGGINESDVMLAVASDALVVGFNVRADAKSRELAKREKVDLRFYTVIYNLVDDITQALEGKLKPLVEETVMGRAKVREMFRISKVGMVAGCIVLEGVIHRHSKVRLLRDNVQVYTGDIQALKRFKDDAKEVRDGMECGICLDKFTDFKENDVIETFVLAEVRQTIG